MGSYGNHIRWLLLLDDMFKYDRFFPLSKWDLELFNTIKGKDWPKDYAELSSMPNWVQQEVNELVPDLKCLKLNTITEKIDFILEYVYPYNRNNENWLEYESRYREQFNDIKLSHSLDDADKYINKMSLILDPNICYENYIRFYPLFANKRKGFIKNVKKFNDIAIKKYDQCVIDISVIYNKNLDYNTYKAMISCFNLADNYEYACKIHERWYEIHSQIF